ncbi:MAG: PKD domain-containing protein [Methanomicrobiales archaeon]|nr:PKD domain-containing protein [Methanomicrobiales archaeon]
MTAPSGATCCDNDTNIKGSRQIRVLAPPYAQFENVSATGYCAPRTFWFEDRTTNDANHGLPTAWQWNFGDNTDNETTQHVTHEYQRSGTYTVTLTASNVAGSSTAQKKVSVGGDPVAGFSGSPRSGKAPLKVFFTDESIEPNKWKWDFGDGSETNETQNPYHIYEKPGLYYVNLTVTNECSDHSSHSSNKSDYIAVYSSMTPYVLFNKTSLVNSPNPVNGTPVLKVYFLANTTDGTLIDEVTWNFGDGNKSRQDRKENWPSNNLWFNTSWNYYSVKDYSPSIQITNSTYDSGFMVYPDHIGVYNPLNVSFRISPSNVGVVGQEFTFTDTSPDNLTEWEWNFGDGNKTNGSSIVKHSYSYNASEEYPVPYPVILSGWNKYGGGDWTSQLITINKAENTSDLKFVPDSINLINGSQNDRQVNILLQRADFGLNSYKIRIDLDSVDHAKIRNWYMPPSWVSDFNHMSSESFRSLTITGLNRTWSWPAGSSNISLGNISLYGVSPGSDVIRFNETDGSSTIWYGSSKMNISGIQGNIRTSGVPVLPGYENQPRDLWPKLVHDGLIDDFNGDGQVNTKDVYVFFNAYAHGHLDGLDPSPFDYNRNGVIDPDDIVKYFNIVIRSW